MTMSAVVLSPQIVYYATGPGPTGPQGPPGADGTSGTSTARLLSGIAAPLSGSGLDPLDGVNDPWRWWPTFTVWVGPAYRVTWSTGDVVPALTTLPTGAPEMDLYIGEYVAPRDLFTPSLFAFENSATFPQATGSTLVLPDRNTGPITATRDGAGVAFLLQYETDYSGTAVPDPTVDITTLLGDVVVGDPYVWPEGGDGNDGDFWVRGTGTVRNLYGPKTAGTWPSPPVVLGLDPAADEAITGAWDFAPPLIGTLDEFGISDATETVPLTLTAQSQGTAALNVMKYDGSPVNVSGYGVSHLDSDGGGAFAGERVAFSEYGHFRVNAETNGTAFVVSSGGTVVFSAGGVSGQGAMDVGMLTAETAGLTLYAANAQTAHLIRTYSPELDSYTFVVAASGATTIAPADPAKAPLTMTGGTEPDDGDLTAGQMAQWFDPTAGAPVVHFKAKDAAGDVYVASLPMTPA